MNLSGAALPASLPRSLNISYERDETIKSNNNRALSNQRREHRHHLATNTTARRRRQRWQQRRQQHIQQLNNLQLTLWAL